MSMCRDDILKLVRGLKEMGDLTFIKIGEFEVHYDKKESYHMPSSPSYTPPAWFTDQSIIPGAPLSQSQTFATNPISSIIPDLKPEELIKPMSPLDEMSPEEIKYYATPRYAEIQAEKEAHKQKLKDEGKL